MSDISESRSTRYYCFGNLPVHATSFVLAIILAVFWIGVFINSFNHVHPSSERVVEFLLILACFLAVIYGNRSMKVIYYYPVIYVFRPFILYGLIVSIYHFYDEISSGPTYHKYDDVLPSGRFAMTMFPLFDIICCSIAFKIFNIVALDAMYVAEMSNQPSYWNKLKKRIVQALS